MLLEILENESVRELDVPFRNFAVPLSIIIIVLKI